MDVFFNYKNETSFGCKINIKIENSDNFREKLTEKPLFNK